MSNDQKLESLLTGQAEEALVLLSEKNLGKGQLQKTVAESLFELKEKAHEAGFDLQVVSAFRSFQDQLKIWNQKATGLRAVNDLAGKPVNIAKLSRPDLVKTILLWSALPGASRHHWGTDFDVIDAARVPEGYSVQLSEEEVKSTGIFGPLHDWLDTHMTAHGFYRPYDIDRGGVRPERWHLSYFPLSHSYTQAITEAMILKAWKGKGLELLDVLEKNISELFFKYVKNVGTPPKIKV